MDTEALRAMAEDMQCELQGPRATLVRLAANELDSWKARAEAAEAELACYCAQIATEDAMQAEYDKVVRERDELRENNIRIDHRQRKIHMLARKALDKWGREDHASLMERDYGDALLSIMNALEAVKFQYRDKLDAALEKLRRIGELSKYRIIRTSIYDKDACRDVAKLKAEIATIISEDAKPEESEPSGEDEEVG